MKPALIKENLDSIINLPLHQQLGIQSISSKDGTGLFTIDANESVLNPGGSFHGGVHYLLADVCAYAGLLSILDDEIHAVTHNFQASILRPAYLGARITYRSHILKLGKTLAFVEVSASCEEKVIAKASVTKSLITKT